MERALFWHRSFTCSGRINLFKYNCSLSILNVKQQSNLTCMFTCSMFSPLFDVEEQAETVYCLPKMICVSEKLELGIKNVSLKLRGKELKCPHDRN